MADPKDSEPSGQETESEAESAGDGTINDPLTRTDVEAPRVPFGSAPDS
ncbi:MAG: hypothetical protein LC713_04210 [Actinobacteria bacterium]|nr:hypothetical protein [Actinomycetota bacterium]